MPEEDNKILKYNHSQKSKREPFVIYADLESLFEKMNTYHNNPEKSSTTKINQRTPSAYLVFPHCPFDTTKSKFDYYRGKNSMKNFCLDLREHVTKTINYEKKEMIPLTNEEKKMHRRLKKCFKCKIRFSTDNNNKKHHKVKVHCHYTGIYRGAAHDICNLRYKIPKEIPAAFHNGSTYDYHFIIKQVVQEFERHIEYLGEDTENAGLRSEKRTDCKSSLDYMINKDDKLIFTCFECKKNYEKDFNKELIKRFTNIYECYNEDINKIILLLKKGVYPYEYMDSWERFGETSLPDKDAFFGSLNLEDITDVYHRHANNVFQKFKLKHLGEYHDLCVQSDILLLPDVFENFRNMCIEIYELDPAHFLSAPGLAWQVCLKITGVEL